VVFSEYGSDIFSIIWLGCHCFCSIGKQVGYIKVSSSFFVSSIFSSACSCSSFPILSENIAALIFPADSSLIRLSICPSNSFILAPTPFPVFDCSGHVTKFIIWICELNELTSTRLTDKRVQGRLNSSQLQSADFSFFSSQFGSFQPCRRRRTGLT